jgi:hypothetical protein
LQPINFKEKKNYYEQTATVEEIKRHSEKVRRGEVIFCPRSCPHCQASADRLKPHAVRHRQFYVIVDQMIQIVIGLLLRWKCSVCKRTFTDYPSFAIPYKRFTVSTILAFAGAYIFRAKMTYRGLIHKNPIGYEESEKQMEFSTPHRWISTLGSFVNTIRSGMSLVLEANPMSSIARDLAGISIDPRKYRSDGRKIALQNCGQLCRLESEYQKIFGASIFTNLATSSGYS